MTSRSNPDAKREPAPEHGSANGSADSEQQNAPPDRSDKAFADKDLLDSRGGTRTHDPGIMSAVL